MSKGIKYGLIGFFGLMVVGLFAFTLMIDSMVKSSIEDIGSEMTGTEVSVSGVSVSLFSGKGTVRGFRVANPEGYGKEFAVEVDEFSIVLDVMSLFSDEILVHNITVLSPSIYVEQKLPENNIKTILDHMEGKDAFETSDSEMIIEKFLLQNGKVDLFTEVGGERSAQVEIETIEMTDLGRGGGRNAVENIVREIAEEVGEKALRAAVRSGGEQLRDAVRDIFN